MFKISSLLSMVLVASSVNASEYKYEITPLVGANIVEGGLHLQNQLVLGGEIQFNNIFDVIKPEVQYLYSLTTDYVDHYSTTSISRLGINGVYEFSDKGLTPFIKMGVGYEKLWYTYFANVNSPYVSSAVGLKIPISGNFSAKIETQYMLKHNDGRYDSNLAVLAGITFAFGAMADKVVAHEEEPVAVVQEEKPEKKEEPAKKETTASDKSEEAAVVVASTAAVAAVVVLKDSDEDGVKDRDDECPNTLTNAPVDEKGCATFYKTGIVFGYNSSVIESDQEVDVQALSKFLKDNPMYNLIVTGHADAIGSELFNLKLSNKRAQAVKAKLISLGVSADRISTVGKGELDPIANNKTKEGRTKNRRLEIDFVARDMSEN